VQRAGEEGVGALGLDSVKVVLAQAQQAEVTLQDVAVDNARAHQEGRVNEGVQVDAFQILANESQARLVAQVVRQLLDQKVTHLSSVLFHPQGEKKMKAKLLISIENVTILSCQLTDSG
jgi:hypothetical protein